MEIISLELSGFKNYESKTQFNFKDKHNNLIFEMEGSSKSFFFETILGVIFGFNSEEKVRFRGDPELNKTFTAMITMGLDERTMIIERDFETDFVACLLSDTKTTRSIFQGKDYAEVGYSRPYLQMLKSIFPIIDKDLFIEVCYELATQKKGNFKDLLATLYSLLTPHFKFSNVKHLVNEGNSHQKECKDANKTDDQLLKIRAMHQAVRHMVNIQEAEDDLRDDITKLEFLITELKSRYNLSQQTENLLQQEYPKLIPFNPLQLRADVLIWKSLLSVIDKNEEKLRSHDLRKQHLTNILKHDLYEYTLLPQSFNKDAERYKEQSSQVNYLNESLKDYEYQIEQMQATMDKGKRFWMTAIFTVPVILAMVSYFIAGPIWIFIVPETIISFLILLFLSGHSKHIKRNKIYHLQEETHILEKRIHDVENECHVLIRKSKLLRDHEFIDSHIERFRKSQEYQRELKLINREQIKLKELIISDTYQGQLSKYTEKYGDAIDVERRDLETYLDEYVSTCQELEKRKQSLESYPVIEELQNLCNVHLGGLKELQQARQKMTKNLKIGNGSTNLQKVLDSLDRQIKNIELKSNINTISSLL